MKNGVLKQVFSLKQLILTYVFGLFTVILLHFIH